METRKLRVSTNKDPMDLLAQQLALSFRSSRKKMTPATPAVEDSSALDDQFSLGIVQSEGLDRPPAEDIEMLSQPSAVSSQVEIAARGTRRAIFERFRPQPPQL